MTNRKFPTIAVLLTLAMTALPSVAASFDCAKASGETEKQICADSMLSTMDEILSRAYRIALVHPADRELVREWQKAWLVLRNMCGDADCMRDAYREQIAELSERAALAGSAVSLPHQGRSGVFERFVRGKRDANASRLIIVELKNDRARVMGSASHAGNPAKGAVNVGEINGIAMFTGDAIVFQQPEFDACRFLISLGKNGLVVSGDTGQCGGHNVSFNGDYRRTNALK